MISDRHIATYQAGQTRITHMLHVATQNGTTYGTCSCDQWGIESTGTDPSSKAHVTRRYDSHTEEP